MPRAKFVNIFKRDDLFFRGHIFCYNIAAMCCRLEGGLPYSRKQTILYILSACTVISFSGMPRILLTVLTTFRLLFMSIILIHSISIQFPFNFFTHLSCTGIHGTSRWSRYITSQANDVRANRCLCQGYIKPNIG